MIICKKVGPKDHVGRLACAAIMSRSAEHDDVQPTSIEAMANTIELSFDCGATIELGTFRDEPVAVITYDHSMVTVHCLPEVRQHQLHFIALQYGVNEVKRQGGSFLTFWPESLDLFHYAKELGFRPYLDDEEECLDESMYLRIREEVLTGRES